jgi:hypothetical protein
MTPWLLSVAARAPRYDGEDPGEPLGTVTALAIFVGIPVAVTIIIALLVLAPGWTRTARSGGSTNWEGDALWLGAAESPVVSGEQLALPAGRQIGERGGASGRW